MKTCCICGTGYKDRQKESRPKESDHILIYGCRKCQKGSWEKNNNRGDFQFGEIEKKGDKL